MAEMTGLYVGANIDLQVREIVVSATGLPDVSHVLSTMKLEAILDDDSGIWFWREIEGQFDIAVTRAQKTSLLTVGHVIHYLKVRRKQEAHG